MGIRPSNTTLKFQKEIIDLGFQISGYGEFDLILTSGSKAIISIAMVIIWIFLLSKIKNWIFQTELNP